jgi:diaminopimelate decarboxylase
MADFVDRRYAAVQSMAQQNLIGPDQPAVGIVDLEAIRGQIESLNWAFASIPETMHMVACKSVTLLPLLRFLADQGMGCEVASPGEFALAEAAGFTPDRIVLDSPAKTLAEIRHCLTVGAAMNIDSYQEMSRVEELREELDTTSVIGVRVNPVVGSGSIGEMSTATTTTKFGIPLIDETSREELVDAIAARPWITQLHVHSGSQGIPLELAAEGISRIVALAESVNERAGQQQIVRLDIGGGLSVNFASDEITPTYHQYADVIQKTAPELFSGKYAVLTEFGRSLLAKAGSIATIIEYTKKVGQRDFAIGHAGAQTATRTVFMPESWPLRVSAFHGDGTPSRAENRIQDLAGPCCFSGDMIGREYVIPELAPGDIALIHDTGAYYFSTPFAYNALPRIPVYAYTVDEAGEVTWTVIRRQQTIAEILAESGEDVRLEVAAPAGS